MGQHDNTRALITGGAQGLGFAIANQLVDEGCRHLVLVGRTAEKGAKAVAALAARGVDAHFIATDVSDLAQVEAMLDSATETLGHIDVLVNSAADTGRGSILDTPVHRFDEIFATNVRSPYFMIQRVARDAVAAGRSAQIVNILSVVIYGGQSFLSPYSASKAALTNITKNAAHALAKDRIRVNGIAVGWMNTPGEDMIQKKYHDANDNWLDAASERNPMGQLVEPENVAHLAAFLAGPNSGVMTGSIVDFDQRVIGTYPE